MRTLNNTTKRSVLVILSGLMFLATFTLTGCNDIDSFIKDWVILDPIRTSGLTDSAVQAAVKREYFPNQFTVVPSDGDTVTIEGTEYTWHAVETEDYNVNLYYFAEKYGYSSANALFWAVTVIDCPQEMHNVRLSVGVNAAAVWWVNGEEVIGLYNDRQTVVDDGVSKRLTLKQGRNVIRGAIINASGAADFCARLLDANDEPITGLNVTID